MGPAATPALSNRLPESGKLRATYEGLIKCPENWGKIGVSPRQSDRLKQ